MYKEAISREFISNWQSLLWTSKDLKIFNIVIHENWKLLEIEIFANSLDCISDNIFRYHFLF